MKKKKSYVQHVNKVAKAVNKLTKSLHEMSDKEFEAYLKKNKLTGMAAVAASRKRRALKQIKQTQGGALYGQD